MDEDVHRQPGEVSFHQRTHLPLPVQLAVAATQAWKSDAGDAITSISGHKCLESGFDILRLGWIPPMLFCREVENPLTRPAVQIQLADVDCLILAPRSAGYSRNISGKNALKSLAMPLPMTPTTFTVFTRTREGESNKLPST